MSQDCDRKGYFKWDYSGKIPGGSFPRLLVPPVSFPVYSSREASPTVPPASSDPAPSAGEQVPSVRPAEAPWADGEAGASEALALPQSAGRDGFDGEAGASEALALSQSAGRDGFVVSCPPFSRTR